MSTDEPTLGEDTAQDDQRAEALRSGLDDFVLEPDDLEILNGDEADLPDDTVWGLPGSSRGRSTQCG